MTQALDRLELCVVVDDVAGQDSALLAQHGLSVWLEGMVEGKSLRILLDVGQNFETLRHNMALLGLAPERLDALVLSPVFPAGGASASKAALAIDGFKALRAHAPCPAYALGGVNAGNVAELLGSGACGIAGVNAVQTAFRP